MTPGEVLRVYLHDADVVRSMDVRVFCKLLFQRRDGSFQVLSLACELLLDVCVDDCRLRLYIVQRQLVLSFRSKPNTHHQQSSRWSTKHARFYCATAKHTHGLPIDICLSVRLSNCQTRVL